MIGWEESRSSLFEIKAVNLFPGELSPGRVLLGDGEESLANSFS